MDTYNPSKLTAAPKKVDISLRQLADFDATGGDRDRVDNVRDNQILVSLSKLERPKTFSFHYISDILLGGNGVTISTDKDGITSITNTGVTKIIAGSNISISPITGVGDVTINNTATPTPLGYYGAFQDITNQTAAVINTGYPMKLGITDLSNQVTVVSNSRITIANTGIYNIQWSGQFTNPLSSEHDVTIWLRKNGVDVSGSAGVVLVPPKHGTFDGHTLPAWNYLLNAVAGDYYEFVWSTANTSVYLSFTGAGSPPPSAASVIVTVTQQSGIMAGTGITAINSLTGAVQTLATGTTGTDFGISSTGTTHTFNVPIASATNTGKLSSTDWATFNAKQNALGFTPVPETRTLTINGTTQDLSANRTFTIATNVGTVTSVAALTLATTGTDLSSTVANGTSTPVITLNVPTASATNRGALSSADWSVFNGKQGAITLTTTGTSGAATFIGNTLNIPQYAGTNIYNSDGSLTAARTLTLNTFALTIAGTSSSRFFANGNVGIGTTTDAGFKLDVNGTARIVGDSIIQGSNALSGANALLVRNTSSVHGLSVTNNAEVKIGRNQLFTISDTSTGGYVFSIAASNSGISFTNTALGSRPVSFSMNTGEILRIHQSYTAIVTNSFLVGTTTDVSSSILTLASTTKGFLPPRMTNAQRLAIASPAVGLIVYCTDAVEGLYVNKSTGWTFVI